MDFTDLAPLDIDRVQSGLKDLDMLVELVSLPSVDSTNRFLRDLPADRFRHGVVAITDFQEAGRGRLSRNWIAPPRSSLLASVILKYSEDVPAGDFVMLGGLAAREAVQEVSGLGATLKWPNDVLLNGRKVCGILSEALSRQDLRFAILGIGINVNFDPLREDGTGGDASSLAVETGHLIDREDLAIALFKRVDLWYRDLEQVPGSVFTAWTTALNTIGSRVVVQDASGVWQGTATGVRRDGGLIVRTEQGADLTVYAANVSIRTPREFTSA
jgi:BirA family transcriptional regulator, biotin operon repressor / biotin---[acetyl-CoA-carboxylase] ligase